MTEHDWRTATEPQGMLQFLRGTGRASDRKLRLFACACCRASPPLLTHEPLRKGVETAERYADTDATHQEMVWRAKAAARQGWSLAPKERALSNAVWATTAMNLWFRFCPVTWALRTVRHLLFFDKRQAPYHTALLRDILGNPFRPVALDPDLPRLGVVGPTQAIYDCQEIPTGNLDPARLAALARALEEAGCQDAELLGHLQGPGPHTRGCWPVDLILGKT
jgi:hypothetical protein